MVELSGIWCEGLERLYCGADGQLSKMETIMYRILYIAIWGKDIFDFAASYIEFSVNLADI